MNLATKLMQLLVTHGGAAWESLGMMQGSLDTGPMFNALRLKETVRSPPSFTVWIQPLPFIHAWCDELRGWVMPHSPRTCHCRRACRRTP